MGVSRKQSTPNFPKNEHFLPLDTHTYVSGGKKIIEKLRQDLKEAKKESADKKANK